MSNRTGPYSSETARRLWAAVRARQLPLPNELQLVVDKLQERERVAERLYSLDLGSDLLATPIMRTQLVDLLLALDAELALLEHHAERS